MLIAIDGPAGAGKSTVARTLAQRLGFTYLDTGAMYRCVALLSLRTPERTPAALAREAQIELPAARTGDPARVLLDGRDVTERLREGEISERASLLATDPGVRDALVEKQRALLARGEWVAEGRDIGTVVAPDAQLKVFLTADARERARRRALELGADPATVLVEQTLRDQRDSSREHGRLAPAPDAITIDTSAMPIEEAVERIAELAREIAVAPPPGRLGGEG